jgi:hypothetical protein
MNHDHDELESLLQTHKPRLETSKLEAARERVRPAARRRAPSIVVTFLLSLGLLGTVGGTSLAVSGLGSDTTARQAQYPEQRVDSRAPTLTPPATTTPDSGGAEEETRDDGDVLGEAGAAPAAGDGPSAGRPAGNDGDGLSAPRELAAAGGESELPFTGWAALPILLVGLVSLFAGIALRRGTRSVPTA